MESIAFSHDRWVLHRDLKPTTFLGSYKFVVPVHVFFLAHYLMNRWYRVPELLFGAKQYGEGVDMWAFGCIFAELLLGQPFLAGDTDIEQLGKIFHALGTPKEAVWPVSIHPPP